MNKHVINNNSSLADFMTYFIEASGLQERIAEIVKDAIAASLPSSQMQQDNSEDSSYYTRSELCQLALGVRWISFPAKEPKPQEGRQES